MKKILLITVLLTMIFAACETTQDEWALNYYLEHYSRWASPDGSTINFFRIYENDSIMLLNSDEVRNEKIFLSIDFPENALDSGIIVNAYEYENFEVISQDIGEYVAIESDFLYFIAIPPSSGYLAETTTPIRGDFNSPATVTYHIDTIYNPNDQFNLYRIGIPPLVELESSGGQYIGGYNEDDMSDVIAGYITPDGWTTEPSLENWSVYTHAISNYDWENRIISFEITNFNYIYCVARVKGK